MAKPKTVLPYAAALESLSEAMIALLDQVCQDLEKQGVREREGKRRSAQPRRRKEG